MGGSAYLCSAHGGLVYASVCPQLSVSGFIRVHAFVRSGDDRGIGAFGTWLQHECTVHMDQAAQGRVERLARNRRCCSDASFLAACGWLNPVGRTVVGPYRDVDYMQPPQQRARPSIRLGILFLIVQVYDARF